MQVKTQDKSGVIICYVAGEVNMSTSPDFKKEFEKILGAKAKKIIINFAGVTYIDSSGLATIVEIFKKLSSYGGQLRLSNLSPKVKNLFELTKLEKLFKIAATEEEAIKTFK